MNTRRIITILIVLLAIGGIVLVLFKNKKALDESKKPVDRSLIPVYVTLDTVKMQDISGEFSLPAALAAKTEANITAEIGGRIQTLNIELGSYVRQGQAVGHIDVSENQLKLEAAELAIEKLNRDYERNKVLLEGNATNANAVTDAKYDLDSKKLEAAQLRSQIAKANLISPVSGTIAEKKVVAGEYVNTGTTIAAVVDMHYLKARVNVPENKVYALKKGQTARITTASFPGKNINGIINFISPRGDDNHNYQVELLVESTDVSLKAGLYVQVSFGAIKNESALQIPKSALVEGIKNPYVYVADSNIAQERKLVVGRENGEYVEVLSGLKEGELVIGSGQINVLPGSHIEAIQKK